MINIADPSARILLLRQMMEAVSRQIEFWDSICRLEELIEADPTLWVQAAAVGVNTVDEITMEDVDKFLPELEAIMEDYRKQSER